ncbi:MAG: acyltransferase family protein [Terrisporobacter sp.]
MEDRQQIGRDYYFDNLKGLLIFTVVFGHFLGRMQMYNDGARTLYSFIYIFHMPLFILVSGYFSKKFRIDRIIDIMLVYIIWQLIIYPIGFSLFSGKPIDNLPQTILYPRYSYWYLLSLINWKLITPLLPKSYMTLLGIFIISFIPSISHKVDWEFMSIGRTIGFYPFFYLGYLLDKESVKKICSKMPKFVSIVGIFLIIILSNYVFVEERVGVGFLFYKGSLGDYVSTDIGILIFRNICIFVTLFVILCICSLVNDKKTPLTKWGQNTLVIYLTHAFILKSMKFTKGSLSLLTFLILAVCFVYGYCEVTSSNLVKKYVGVFTNFSTKKIFSKIKFKIRQPDIIS